MSTDHPERPEAMTSAPQTPRHRPRILVFFCSQCGGAEAPSSSFRVGDVPAVVTTVHFSCAREVTPDDIVHGFRGGADGVLICGCLVRNCPASENDLTVLRGLYRNQVLMKNLGLATDRLREEWILEGTTDTLDALLSDFSRQLAAMGPLTLAGPEPAALREDAGEA